MATQIITSHYDFEGNRIVINLPQITKALESNKAVSLLSLFSREK